MNTRNNKEIQVKPLDYKWHEFLIAYTILNMWFFLSTKNITNSIYEMSSHLFTSKKVLVDGADFSILGNLFAAPLFLLLVIALGGILLLLELIIMLVFKFIYFKSIVNEGEKIKLLQNIRTAILCFILINIIGALILTGIHQVKFFIFLYFPVPFFTYVFIYLKMKRL